MGRGVRRDEERKVEGHDGPLKKVDLELQLASQSPQHWPAGGGGARGGKRR